MIQALSIIVSLYVIVRCISLISRTGDRKENIVVIVAAAITIVITLLLLVSVILTGNEPTDPSSILGR